MTREETLGIMSVLKATYPNYYKGMSKTDAIAVVDLWASMFAEDSLPVVTAAVKALLASDTKGYPPHIGAVKEKVRLITTPQETTEQEAWALVMKAIKNSGYKSREEFDKLPPMLQRLVGSPNQLREWGMMDMDTVGTVVASNFMRSYRARSQSEKEIAALPSDVRKMLGEAVSGLMLGSGN